MKRAIALLALLAALGLGACGREPPHAASTAPQPAAAAPPQAASTAAPPASPAAAAAAQPAPPAAAAKEPGADAQSQSGTASLEHMAAMPASQQLPGGRWKAGVNYDAISPAQPTSAAPGKVEVMEVFWLGCPHCYALEPYIQKWLKSKPSYVEFVRVPVMWGPVHRLHAHLFYTLEALHRDDLVEQAFDAIHKDNNPLIGTTEQDTLDKQLQWAQSKGVDPDAFRKAYNSFGVNADLEHAQEITDRYHVEGVPFIAVDGKYSTDVGKAGGHPELIQLINYLAGLEHQRSHRG